MKKRSVLLVLIFPLIFSCAKKNNSGPENGTIAINGTFYPTVAIGNQVWTTQNYSGAGGNEIVTTTGDPLLNGNYYNAENITLPAGWRIPSRQDFNTLLSNFSSVINTNGDVVCDKAVTESLCSKTGWEGLTGNNLSGFNAYAAGSIYDMPPLPFSADGKTDYAEYLTSTTDPANDYSYALQITNVSNSANQGSYTAMAEFPNTPPMAEYYVSVRFVKDK